MNTSPELDKIAPALAKAQSVIEGAAKAKVNPHFRSKYADLAACWDACREELTSNGISVIQALKPSTEGITVQTRLQHASGQFVEDEGLFLPASKHDAQGYGSALTYARRYGLCAMVGIAPEDDDGNAASKGKTVIKNGRQGPYEAQEATPNGPTTPTTGMWEAMDTDMQIFLTDVAANVKTLLGRGKMKDAYDELESHNLEVEAKAAIWTRFDSKERSALKKEGASRHQPGPRGATPEERAEA